MKKVLTIAVFSSFIIISSAYANGHARVVSSLGVVNATPYYLVLSQNPPNESHASCKDACYETLNPQDSTDGDSGGQQWVDIDSQSGWIDVEYNICSAVAYNAEGEAQCNGYVGHVGISFSASKTIIADEDGGQASLSAYQAGEPFQLTFTPNSTTPVTLPTPSVYSSLPLRGINLSGAEFASGFQLPYASDAEYYDDKGMNFIRLPFKWEYIQPDLSKPIDFTQGNAKQLADLVAQLTDSGLTVMLDMHNYLRYDNSIIGAKNSAVTAQNYANAWAAFAAEFATNPRVYFDLMNEPHDVDTETVLNDYNAAIAAIRNAGFNNKLMLEGNGWAGLYAWTQDWYGTPNSQVFIPANIQDPDNNYVINVHEYFDGANGGGGGGGQCVDPHGVLQIENFQTFVDWVHQYKVPAFLSEIGSENTDACIKDVDVFLAAVEKSAYVDSQGGFLGWSAWAGGHAWNGSNYPLDLDEVNGQEVPQMSQGYDKHLTPVVQ